VWGDASAASDRRGGSGGPVGEIRAGVVPAASASPQDPAGCQPGGCASCFSSPMGGRWLPARSPELPGEVRGSPRGVGGPQPLGLCIGRLAASRIRNPASFGGWVGLASGWVLAPVFPRVRKRSAFCDRCELEASKPLPLGTVRILKVAVFATDRIRSASTHFHAGGCLGGDRSRTDDCSSRGSFRGDRWVRAPARTKGLSYAGHVGRGRKGPRTLTLNHGRTVRPRRGAAGTGFEADPPL